MYGNFKNRSADDYLRGTFVFNYYYCVILQLLCLISFVTDTKTRYYYLLFCTVVTFFDFVIFVPAQLLLLRCYYRDVITAILLPRCLVVYQHWRQFFA